LIQAVIRGIERRRQSGWNCAGDGNEQTTQVDDQSDPASLFRGKILEKYGSVQQAFAAFDAVGDVDGKITRSDFKTILSSLLNMKLAASSRGKLRKLIDKSNTKMIGFSDLLEFFETQKENDASLTSTPQQVATILPLDVPKLPDG
jgi:hypothetical protein